MLSLLIKVNLNLLMSLKVYLLLRVYCMKIVLKIYINRLEDIRTR